MLKMFSEKVEDCLLKKTAVSVIFLSVHDPSGFPGLEPKPDRVPVVPFPMCDSRCVDRLR